MERKYNVYTLYGNEQWNGRNYVLKEVSVVDALKDTSSCDTKQFFGEYRFKEVTLTEKELGRKVEEGWIIFPVSTKVRMAEVREAYKAGFVPVFMRVTEMRELRKEWA